MTTAELLILLRIRFDDTVTPYLVSDDDCIDALSRAQNIFASETFCIFDATQTSVATANDPFISLPTRTVWTKAALFDTTLLRVVTQHELDYGYFSLNGFEAATPLSNWRSKTGTPKFLVTDLGVNTARLVPYPNVDGTVAIERYRLPVELHLTTQDPEIPEQFHRDLLTGALTYLYEILDADAYAPEEAVKAQVKWQVILDQAKIQLQTYLRKPERYMELPSGTVIRQESGAVSE